MNATDGKWQGKFGSCAKEFAKGTGLVVLGACLYGAGNAAGRALVHPRQSADARNAQRISAMLSHSYNMHACMRNPAGGVFEYFVPDAGSGKTLIDGVDFKSRDACLQAAESEYTQTMAKINAPTRP